MHEEDQDSSSRNPPSVGNPSPCQLSPHQPPPTAVYHPPPPGAPMYPHPGHLPPQLPPPTTVLIPPAQSTNYNTDRITDQHNYNYYGPVHNSGQAQDVPQNRGMAQEDPGSADTINSDVETKLRENFSKVKVNRDELDKAMEVMNGLKMVSCKEAMIRQIHRGVKLTDLKKYIDLMCESLNLPKEHEKQLRAKLEIIELADDTCDAPLTVDYEYSNFKSVYGFLCAIKTGAGSGTFRRAVEDFAVRTVGGENEGVQLGAIIGSLISPGIGTAIGAIIGSAFDASARRDRR